MLNFGASLQQAAVSHLGMPLSFPSSLRLRGQPGHQPRALDISGARGPGLHWSRGGGRGFLPAHWALVRACVSRSGLGQEGWDLQTKGQGFLLKVQ